MAFCVHPHFELMRRKTTVLFTLYSKRSKRLGKAGKKQAAEQVRALESSVTWQLSQA